jgi:uncharacterized MnhB-related membrane protein
VNNAVARVGGLIAIAVFGILLVRTFEARARAALDRLQLPAAVRTSIERELPKLAGAEIAAPVDPGQRAAIGRAIDESFVSAFRRVMLTAAAVALAAAIAGAVIR